MTWYLKQLLPLAYWTEYGNPDDGTWHFVMWRMWLGRCFDIVDVVVDRSDVEYES